MALQYVKTSVNFSLQVWNIDEPGRCDFQYCFATNVSVGCTTTSDCRITLPQFSIPTETELSVPPWINPNISYSRGVYFQWSPLDDMSGDLIITSYNTQVNHYEGMHTT